MSFDTSASHSSELFASYEADYKLAVAEISQKLDAIAELTGEPRKAAIHTAERAVDEADEIIGQMQLELNNLPSSMHPKIKPRLRNYSSDLDKSRREILKFAQNADRDALFNSRGDGSSGDAVMDQRQQLLSGTERLERSSRRLQDSERLANETEGIGANTLNDLRGQRETLLNTHDTLNDSERYLDRSLKTLRGMARWLPIG